MDYRHTQFGWIIIAASLVVIIVLSFSNLGVGASGQGQNIAALLLVAILGLFYSLTVEVKDGTLNCRFGPGIIRRRFLLSDIEDAQSVRNPWYAGWGIRWMPGRCVLWNVAGLQAVELVLKNGNRFRIGTDEPDALVQAIKTNKTLQTTINE